MVGKVGGACKGCMHTSVYLLDFKEILDVFKDKQRLIQLLSL